MSWSGRLVWAVLLMLVAGAMALVVLPARWLMVVWPQAWPVTLVDAQGTIWQASARVAVGAPGLRRTLPEPLRWGLGWSGGPRLRMTHPWLRGPQDLSLSWRGVSVSAQSLQAPASLLTTAHTLFNTLDPGGDLLLSWPELQVGRSVNSVVDGVVLTIQWRKVSSALSRVQPLGDYVLTISQDTESGTVLTLRTEQGPLRLEGAGRMSFSGKGWLDGRAGPDPSATPVIKAGLQSLLQALGPVSAQSGDVTLRLR